MKSLFEYINESVFDKDLVKKGLVNDHPQNKAELLDSIRKYIDILKPRRGETIDLNWIDTSKIDDMGGLFEDKSTKRDLNYDVSDWNVSNVNNFANMFSWCKNFDCDLSKWDVSSGKYFGGMFTNCKNFKGQGLDNWKIDPHANTYQMFKGCKSITLPSWADKYMS